MRRLAALLMAVAAGCGGDDGNKQTDAGVDSVLPDIDAPVNTPVTITVSTNGVPMTGVRVHFLAPDSSVISSTDTDATGKASALMPNGGTVTAIDPWQGAPGLPTSELYTYAGVKPGDDLQLTNDYVGGTSSQVQVTAPLDTTSADVVKYRFSSPCDSEDVSATSGSGGSVVTQMYFDARCAPNTDIVVASLDANGNILRWLYAPNVATGAAIDLSASTYAAAVDKTLTFTNIPATSLGISFTASFCSTKGDVIELYDDGTEGTSYTKTLATPPFAGALDVVYSELSGPFAESSTVDWSAPSTTYNLDFSTRLLHQATSGTSYDAASHKVTWTEDAAGVTPDFTTSYIYGTRVVQPLSVGVRWQIVAPYTAGEVQLPTLPVEMFDFNFAATDPVSPQETVLAKVPGGYDAIRARFFGLEGPESVITGASGSFVFETIFSANQGVRRRKATTAQGLPTWNVRQHK